MIVLHIFTVPEFAMSHAEAVSSHYPDLAKHGHVQVKQFFPQKKLEITICEFAFPKKLSLRART